MKGCPDLIVGALVDSGAVTCVIHPHLLKELGNKYKMVACGPYSVSLSVSGIETLISHYVELLIECPVFGSAVWKFYVLPNCSSDIVIGMDFLKHFKGKQNYYKDILTFKNAPSGPGQKKRVQLRGLAVKVNSNPGPSQAFKANESDSSGDEVEGPPRVSFANISDDDYKVLEYYKKLNESERANLEVKIPEKLARLPKRVSSSRPFKVRGLSLQKVCVKTDAKYDGDLLIECSDHWLERYGVIAETGIISVRNGVGYTWVANPNMCPVVVPRQLRFGACHIVVDKNSSNTSGKPTKSDNVPLTEEEIARFNFGPELSANQKRILVGILNKYKNAFAWSDKDLTGIVDSDGNIIQASVELVDKTAVDIKPRRCSPEAKRQISQHMARELENGWIEISQSAYGAPVLIVHKKDGSTRPVIDYREVNKKCGSFSHPIPDLQESLDSFRGCEWFCTLDAQDAFRQIWLEKESREILAFSTNEAKYQPLRLPFGFRNSGTIFQAVMTQILAKYSVPWLVNYIDDNAFGAKDFHQMCERLEVALNIMQTHNIRLKPTKCSFGFKEFEYLGHLVSKDGIRIDPERIKEIVEWPAPKCLKDVRSFLGVIGFFRRHIGKYATIALPLFKLMESGVVFRWDKDCQSAFDRLKKAITTAPVLVSPSEDGEVEIFCDASDKAIGGVLLLNTENKRHPVAFYSQKLKKNELNWTVTQKECFSIVRSLEKFRNYVWGREIKVFSDHHSLQWLLDLKDPCARLARWLERIAPFNIKVYHVPGKANCVADELSRIHIRSLRLARIAIGKVESHVGDPIVLRATKVTLKEFDTDLNKEVFDYCEEVKKESFGVMQRNDPKLKVIMNSVQKSELETSEFPGKYMAEYAIVDGVLYKANHDPYGPLWLLVVPEKLRKKVFEEVHAKSLSHLAFEKTYLAIKRNYYWDDMYSDIRRMARTCVKCQFFNIPRKRKTGPWRPMMVPVDPFVKVSLDFVPDLKMTPRGNRNVLVMVDQATRFAVMVATPDQTSATVANVFKNVFLLKCGHVKEVIVDNAAGFTSGEFMDFMKERGTRVTWISPYSPQSNAFVERLNGTFKSMLAKSVNENHEDWDVKLTDVNISYNQAVHSVTGFSPHYLLYAVHPTMEIDNKFPVCKETLPETPEERRMRIYRDRLKANENTCRYQLRQKRNFDKTHDVVVFQKGDKVLFRNFVRKVGTVAKFMVKWKGPYVVYDRVGDCTYMLQAVGEDSDEVLQAHVRNLKKFESSEETESEVEVDYDDSWLDTFIPCPDYPEFHEDFAFVPGEVVAPEVGDNAEENENGGANHNDEVPPEGHHDAIVEEENVEPVDNDADVSDHESMHSEDRQEEVVADELGDDDADEVIVVTPPPPEPRTSRSGRTLKQAELFNIASTKNKSYRKAQVSDVDERELLLRLVHKLFL